MCAGIKTDFKLVSFGSFFKSMVPFQTQGVAFATKTGYKGKNGLVSYYTPECAKKAIKIINGIKWPGHDQTLSARLQGNPPSSSSSKLVFITYTLMPNSPAVNR